MTRGENLGVTLADESETRLQLCGRFVFKLRGQRIEHLLPGRQGRLLVGFLASRRRLVTTRDQMLDALWPGGLPGDPQTALSSLLTKLRRLLGDAALGDRHEPRLVLPEGAWVDVEAASETLHRAESAAALEDWKAVWGPSRVALHICRREFMPGFDGLWIDETRRDLEAMLLRAHDCVARTGLALGGPELASAERSARALIAADPLAEPGYRYLMRALAAREDTTAALRVYEQLRTQLRDQLGIAPSAATRREHQALLGESLEGEHVLCSVLFTDLVSSTERAGELGDRNWSALLSRHNDLVLEQVGKMGGREMNRTGDGFLIAFDRPIDAIMCGQSLVAAVRELGLAMRCGVHCGECERDGGELRGITVHIGARIAALAGPDEVLVSSTVRDLVAGSGLGFSDRGLHQLKGVPGEWRLLTLAV